jgi:hypothetical protein
MTPSSGAPNAQHLPSSAASTRSMFGSDVVGPTPESCNTRRRKAFFETPGGRRWPASIAAVAAGKTSSARIDGGDVLQAQPAGTPDDRTILLHEHDVEALARLRDVDSCDHGHATRPSDILRDRTGRAAACPSRGSIATRTASPRSSADRASASGAVCAGSSPAEGADQTCASRRLRAALLSARTRSVPRTVVERLARVSRVGSPAPGKELIACPYDGGAAPMWEPRIR